MSQKQFETLGRYDKFEKLFPFYKMDVNGFMYRLKECMAEEEPHNKYKPQNTKYISFETWAKGFSMHSYWSDINNEESILHKFIKAELVDHTGKIQVIKLRDLGLLWCDGGKTEKCVEFFENIVPSLGINLSSHDEHFKENLFNLFYFSTEMVFKHEKEYLNKNRDITEDEVEAANNKYDDLYEEFIDDIFGVQTVMQEKEWETKVIKQYPWVFNSKLIREKIYGQRVIPQKN